MKKSFPYHPQLNQIVGEIEDCLSEKVNSNNIELQIKYGFLKNCKNDNDYSLLSSRSLKKPIIMNNLKNARNFRVNAACQPQLYKNAITNLKRLSLKQAPFVEQILVCYILDQTRYNYLSSKKIWLQMDKDKLFYKQYDIISNRKLFRMDCSRKKQKALAYSSIKSVFQKYKNKGFLRFKHTFIHHIHDYFHIEESKIYQTDQEAEILQIKNWVAQSEDISAQVTEKMNLEEKKSNMKYQLELKFTEKGIFFIRQCDEQERKEEISRAFDSFRDITNISNCEDQISKQLDRLTLNQNSANSQKKKNKQKSEQETFNQQQWNKELNLFYQVTKSQEKVEKRVKEYEKEERGKQEEEELVFIVRRK